MRMLIAVLLLTTLIASTGLAQESGGRTSAEDVARELANPNTPLASLNFKLQFRTFKGDLPKAGHQDSTTLLF